MMRPFLVILKNLMSYAVLTHILHLELEFTYV